MEDRQRQIREGAGLEESRLNTEFIEFLKKFSTPLLLCIAVIAGGYFFYNKYKAQREKAIDDAYAQLDAAAQSRNPASLLRVADEHNRGAVAPLARLTAADLALEASRTGVPSGTELDKDGKLPADVQTLTAEQRAGEVKTAEGLYKQVFDELSGQPVHTDLTLIALHGLAACAESRGDLEAAKGFYQQIIDRANAADLGEWAKRAEGLKNTVDTLKDSPRLYSQAELPGGAAAIQPFTTGMSDIKLKGANGETLQIGKDGKIERVDDPTNGATPAPANPADPGATPPANPAPAPAAPAGTPPAAPATPAAPPATAPPATAPTTPPAGEPTKPK
jgi:hypothetical protein